MTAALDARWDARLEAWAEYMLTGEKGGKVKISGAYSKIGRGAPAEGDGIPIHVGEALDTDSLVRKLAAHLRQAVWVWYVEDGTIGDKAARMSIHRDTLTDRVKGAKRTLDGLHFARIRMSKSKGARNAPQTR